MKIKTTTEIEVEVTYPQYRKYGTPLYKLISDKEYIGVRVDESSYGHYSAYDIEIKEGYETTVAMIYNDGEEIAKACFENAFQQALSKLNQLSFLAATQPATEQEKQDEEIFVNDLENVGI